MQSSVFKYSIPQGKIFPVQGAGTVSTPLLHHFLCQTQLAFRMYYCIDNANFKMMPFIPPFG